jgi:ATP-dependent exoDNAse (exonuclease V) beta subunit
LRPDRVIIKNNQAIVIDYKTGEMKKTDHEQVQNYCSILRQMGYKPVKGYLLYTQDIQIVKVEA